ncbi:MAG: hypothetical protein ACFCVD_19150 [Nodosilinea sp.]
MWIFSPQLDSSSQLGHGSGALVLSVSPEGAQRHRSDSTSLPMGEVAVASAGLLVLLSSCVLISRHLHRLKALHTSAPGEVAELHWPSRVGSQLPCPNCRYFSPNGYLSCAVNPMVALKPAARDCPDFCPKPKS